jgi:hypothetical protein
MGTWDISIEGNDTFQVIYSNFMERYNSGDDPIKIKQDILTDFADYFADSDDHNNALFGLSKGLWETKSLDKETLDKVKQIIASESDLRLWRDLGATDELIRKRKHGLDKFLKTISAEKDNPKRRVKKKFEFEKKEVVKLASPDGKKVLDIGEEFGDKKYIHTSGLLMWAGGGGSILYFNQASKDISAKWLDSQTLEIIHDRSIMFSKKDEKAYFMGDEVIIKYTEK